MATGAVGATEKQYIESIKPFLQEKCYSCHGVLKQEADLRLETREQMMANGVIVPGDPDESPLLRRIRSHDEDRMPPKGEGAAATKDQIEMIRRWIQKGALAPEETALTDPTLHWAFQPITQPAIQLASDADNPIDIWLDQLHQRRELEPVETASRALLLRRLYLDLIGLPPTKTELLDQRSIAVIVDELLANPQHGERWARHWMDVWRYSDWYGLGQQLRYSQKHLWHWRDWIVNSLNSGKGYDRMIVEMLAGDEVAPSNEEAIAATGFLARNYYLFNRTTWLDSTIEHTGKAFLGLTLNCAKCHDHKYDPISQLDYYRFRAIFEPHQVRLDPLAGETDFEKAGLPRVFDDQVEKPTYLHRRGDPKDPDKGTVISPGVPALLSGFAAPIEPVTLPRWAYAPGSRDYVLEDHIERARAVAQETEKLLANAKKELEKIKSARDERSDDSQTNDFMFRDDFENGNTKGWNLNGDGWELRDGRLLQTISSRNRHFARLTKSLPRDFEVRCRYTTTGGDTYKSVTFRFDMTETGDANYVYTSAHAPGPKVQVAFERDGNSTYPASGRKAKSIEVNQTYELRFAVRDTLINVWLDDEFLIAYRFPDRRDGGFALSGFDATVAFEDIQITSLSPSVKLVDAEGNTAGNLEDAERSLSIANAKLSLARQKLNELLAVAKAERALANQNSNDTTRNATAAEAQRQQFKTKIESLKLQLIELADGDKKREQFTQAITEARKALAEVSESAPVFTPIRGSKKALESPAHKESDYAASYGSISTGRRTALAKWIVSRQNPLTARVAVNHVWMRHFGTPLVESVFDFGLRAKEPVHRRLLDQLAWEFMDAGWSLPHLHRRIVNSRAYQRSTSTRKANPKSIRLDPDNGLYWRMNSRRMESQVVRDSLLALAGELDTTMGGPSIAPSDQVRRRSLYFQHSRDQKLTFLEMFDNADILQCYRRSESIVPQQALALANSHLAIEMSGKIARRFESDRAGSHPSDQSLDPSSLENTDRTGLIDQTFFLLLGRPASDEEQSECHRFFRELQSLSPAPSLETARARFVQAILNHNDFITIR